MQLAFVSITSFLTAMVYVVNIFLFLVVIRLLKRINGGKINPGITNFPLRAPE